MQEFDTHSENDPTFNHRINKTLHCMVAHLHRYGSELDMLGDAVDCISQNHDEFFKEYPPQPPGTYHPADRVERCLLQVRSQLRSAVILRKELELKVSNILALVSHKSTLCSAHELRTDTLGKSFSTTSRLQMTDSKFGMAISWLQL